MPFNGSGTFVSLPPPDFPAIPNTTILASMFNANLNDIFTNGLTNCLTRDGQSSPTANLPMAGFRLTGLGQGIADTDSAQLGQTLALRGQVGTVDWDSRTSTGIFEATSSSLTAPSANFPPTSNLGQLVVIAQGATVVQEYITAYTSYIREKLSGVWSPWSAQNSDNSQNYVVNSGCQHWQAGTSLGSGTGTRYLMDQVYNESVGSTYTVSRQAFTLGSEPVSGAQYFHQTVVSSVAGAGNFCTYVSPIEGVANFSGRTITISFWASANTTRDIAVEVGQNFGVGGSPSSSVFTFAGKVSITTTLTRYSVTVAVPSVTGKTLGTSDDRIEIRLWFDAGTTFNARTGTLGQQSGTFNIFGLKVQTAASRSEFVMPNISQEFLKCARYYVTYPSSASFSPITFSGNITSGTGYLAVASFPVQMRIVPSLTLPAFLLGGFNAPSSSTATVNGIQVQCNANSTFAGGSYRGGYTADARF